MLTMILYRLIDFHIFTHPITNKYTGRLQLHC